MEGTGVMEGEVASLLDDGPEGDPEGDPEGVGEGALDDRVEE